MKFCDADHVVFRNWLCNNFKGKVLNFHLDFCDVKNLPKLLLPVVVRVTVVDSNIFGNSFMISLNL